MNEGKKPKDTNLKVGLIHPCTIYLTNPFQDWKISLVLLMTLVFTQWGLHN